MLKRIEIDTSGKDEKGRPYYYDFPFNEEIWNIIVPQIKFLVEDQLNMYLHNEIHWESYKQELSKGGNGHCVYLKEDSGYISICDFDYLWFEETFINKYKNKNNNIPYYLSDLIMNISRTNKIHYPFGFKE